MTAVKHDKLLRTTCDNEGQMEPVDARRQIVGWSWETELLSSLREIGETTFTGANEIERQPVTKPCVQTDNIRPITRKKTKKKKNS